MYRELLSHFTLQNLPELDMVTKGALELFADTILPEVDYTQFKRPLVVGSGNAAVVGMLIFDDVDAVFADESSYVQKLKTITDIDGAYLISASGGKHAITIAADLQARGIKTVLLTNNADAPAKAIVGEAATFVFPKNREPYTYNTSTYMGMLLSKTFEDETAILESIEKEIEPLVPTNLTDYEAFYLIVPEHFTNVREMFETKFNELFGPKLMARVFTHEQTKHAKTVIPLDTELFVSFGVENTQFGKEENRLVIPLPTGADYVAMMAIGYAFIGHIQKQFPPYYKERVEAYCKETSIIFGSTIHPIVE
ncbi:MAG: hypothetical protein RLZZ76_441 [Candidatus Parcubacteria bacterium]|jgi:hypothetical protein